MFPGGGDAGKDEIILDAQPTDGSENGVTSGGVKKALDGKVPTTRQVAGKPLSADVEIAPEDIGAAAESHTHAAGEITGILTAAQGGTGSGTVDAKPTAESTNMVTSGGVYTALQSKADSTALEGKQNALKFDTAPTAGSDNPVTSGGILTALNGKANTSHGTHVTFDDAALPLAPAGTASAGTSAKVARADHVHPLQTTVANATKAASADTAAKLGSETVGAVSIPVYLEEGTATPATGVVPSTRKVAGKPLSTDVTIAPGDIGAAAASHGHKSAEISDRQNETTVGPLDKYGDFLITSSTLAYWNGAYTEKGASNIAWCKHGAIGTAATMNRPAVLTLSLGTTWTNSSQTVAASGVVADETKQLIQVMPASASMKAYMDAGVYCSGQSAGNLTFTCSSAPSATLTVYAVVWTL